MSVGLFDFMEELMSFRVGAIGTLTGTLSNVEFKTTPKGKRWAAFALKRGKQTINMKTFVAGVVAGLEMFVEGETVSVFGKLSTQVNNDKAYTNFTALKLYETPEDDSGVTVAGEVTKIVATEHGADVWIDVTENEAYPEQVKFQVAKGVKLPFEEGDVISGAKLEPRGKFCFWTLDTGIAAEKDTPKDFKGKTVRDLSEVHYERETAAPESSEKPATAKAPAEDDYDF